MTRMKRSYKKVSILGTPVLLALLTMALALAGCAPSDSDPEPEEITITLGIDYAGLLDTESHNLTMLTGDTAWDALKEVAVVEATWYPAFGSYFITGINGVGSGNTTLPDHWWMFYVNDESPPLGAGQYALQDGDSLEFKYEEPAW